MTDKRKYQRCMVMAGGGFRFGYYLGMYAAAREMGKAPDLLLASCGGSIAAAVIQALPDDAARRQWLASRPMYDFLRGLRSTPKAALGRAFVHAARRHLRPRSAALVPDLFDDYMFDVPERLPLPPLAEPSVAIAIVGARMLFEPEDVGRPRAGRKLFAEAVFGDARTVALLEGARSPMHDARWGDHAIAPRLIADAAMPVADAVRISIADMFYFRCHTHEHSHYSGGVIDLFPIEVAHMLADSVIMERKAPFNRLLALPALRSVFGIDGNVRLRHVHAQHADLWIDTSDMESALKSHGVRKRLALHRNRILLTPAPDYKSYVANIDAQWKFGYERAMKAFTA